MATATEKQFFQAVEKNDLDAVKSFIEEKGVRVAVMNFKQQCAAHIAAEKGYLPMLQYLISRDRELLVARDDRDVTALHLAVRNGFIDIVKYLIEDLGVDIFASENRFCGDTVVHMAAEEDQLTVLKYFLEDRKIDVNVKDELGASPLFLAAEQVRMRIVKYLIEDRKADATMLDFQRDNILHRSAVIGDLTVPRYLLDERNIEINVDWADNFGRTILHSAARHNALDFVKYFIEKKNANYNAGDKLGNTPLHEAASAGYPDVVKYLVEKGAKIDCKNNRGRTPSDVTKDRNITQYLDEAKGTRSRRSAFALDAVELTTLTDEFHLTGKYYDSMRGMVTNSPRMVKYGNQEDRGSLHVISSSRLQSFLIIANAVWKSSKNSYNASGRKMDLLSPRKIVDNRMDPFAVNAVNDDHYFSAV